GARPVGGVDDDHVALSRAAVHGIGATGPLDGLEVVLGRERATRRVEHALKGQFPSTAHNHDWSEVSRLSAEDVDEYLQGIEEPKRSTLEALRRTILEIVPDAEQVISYKVPAFRIDGRMVAGFAAFKDHPSYLPFSGTVLSELAGELEGYTMTKSALHFPVDEP